MSSCLVVEGSRLARKELIALITNLAIFECIHEASNGEDAKEILLKEDPDVIFLDIHLPGMNGFEFLESLDHIPKVIFTTAYDEYAIKSFDFNAIDYLLKPIKKNRLEKAIEKLELNQEKSIPLNKAKVLQQVFVRDGEKCWFIKISDIRLFESVGNYCKIHFGDSHPLIQRSLTYLEEVLDENTFFRVNRQQIINLNYINKMDTWFNGKLKLTLTTGEEVEVSRRRSSQLKEVFSL